VTETAIKRDSAEPELDEELLAEAMRGVGSSSRNETMNAVLRDYVMRQRLRRREARERLQRMADEGHLDFSRLDELDQ
jgi:Arc/MetJ family transcription regulator